MLQLSKLPWAFLIYGAALLGLVSAQEGTAPVLDDTTFRNAIQLWKTDQVSAVAQYGSIEFWDTSGVTNMSSLELGETFNADLSTWDTSAVVDMSEVNRLLSRSRICLDVTFVVGSLTCNFFLLYLVDVSCLCLVSI